MLVHSRSLSLLRFVLQHLYFVNGVLYMVGFEMNWHLVPISHAILCAGVRTTVAKLSAKGSRAGAPLVPVFFALFLFAGTTDAILFLATAAAGVRAVL